jgi:hypothetical protein
MLGLRRKAEFKFAAGSGIFNIKRELRVAILFISFITNAETDFLVVIVHEIGFKETVFVSAFGTVFSQTEVEDKRFGGPGYTGVVSDFGFIVAIIATQNGVSVGFKIKAAVEGDPIISFFVNLGNGLGVFGIILEISFQPGNILVSIAGFKVKGEGEITVCKKVVTVTGRYFIFIIMGIIRQVEFDADKEVGIKQIATL